MDARPSRRLLSFRRDPKLAFPFERGIDARQIEEGAARGPDPRGPRDRRRGRVAAPARRHECTGRRNRRRALARRPPVAPGAADDDPAAGLRIAFDAVHPLAGAGRRRAHHAAFVRHHYRAVPAGRAARHPVHADPARTLPDHCRDGAVDARDGGPGRPRRKPRMGRGVPRDRPDQYRRRDGRRHAAAGAVLLAGVRRGARAARGRRRQGGALGRADRASRKTPSDISWCCGSRRSGWPC